MRTAKNNRRIAITLTILGAAMCATPDALAGQAHETADRLGGALTSPTAANGLREGAIRGWVGPAARAVALFSTTRAASIQMKAQGTSIPIVPQVRDQRGVPYMVAGGILFVAGAITGGDGGTLLMVGGAGVGAYGAFIYFGG